MLSRPASQQKHQQLQRITQWWNCSCSCSPADTAWARGLSLCIIQAAALQPSVIPSGSAQTHLFTAALAFAGQRRNSLCSRLSRVFASHNLSLWVSPSATLSSYQLLFPPTNPQLGGAVITSPRSACYQHKLGLKRANSVIPFLLTYQHSCSVAYSLSHILYRGRMPRAANQLPSR